MVLALGHCVAVRGRHGPADGTPLHLNFKTGVGGQLHVQAVEPGVAGLGEQGGVAVDQLVDLVHHLSTGELRRVIGRGVFGLLPGDVVAVVLVDRCGVALHLAGERLKHRRDGQAGVRGLGCGHAVFGDRDIAALRRHSRGPPHRGVVGEHRARREHAVGEVHHGLNARRGGGAQVVPDVLRVVFGEEALRVRLHSHGASDCLRHPPKRLDGTVRAQMRSGQQERLLRSVELVRNLRGGLLHCLAVVTDLPRPLEPCRLGLRAFGVRQIGRDFDVAGLGLAQGGGDGVVDLRRGLLCGEDAHRLAGHRAEHFLLVGVIRGADGVVQEPPRGLVVGVVACGDEDHGQALCVGAGDTVQRGERTDVEGDHACRCAVRAGVALGRIGGVELVGAAHHLQILVFEQLVQKLQVVVARDLEVVLQADLLQAGGQVVADSSCHGSPFLNGGWDTNGRRKLL